jgi:hypothetical protein
VNGHAIDAVEFRRHLEALESDAIAQMRGRQSDEERQRIRTETLRAALAEAVRAKIQQIEATRLGLLDDPSYAAFLKRLERENARRARVKAANGVIYGPVHYQPETYYDHELSNLILRLRERLLRDGVISYSDEDVSALFKEKSEELRPPPTLRIEAFRAPALRRAELEKLQSEMRDASSKPVAPAQVTRSKLELSSESRFGHASTEAAIEHLARRTSPGEISAVVESDEGEAFFVRVLSSEPSPVPGLETVKPALVRQLARRVYEAHIERLRSAAHLEVHQPVLEKFRLRGEME